MIADSTKILADNVRRLMADRGDTQTSVAKRGEISQRAVGYLMTYGQSHGTMPTLRTIDGLARAFDLPQWLLFVPDLPLDLAKGGAAARLLSNYLAASIEGRATIDRVAEGEVRYAALQPRDIDAKTGTSN